MTEGVGSTGQATKAVAWLEEITPGCLADSPVIHACPSGLDKVAFRIAVTSRSCGQLASLCFEGRPNSTTCTHREVPSGTPVVGGDTAST